MTRDEWVRHFDSSPEVVRAYLLDEKAVQNEDAAERALAFEDDAWPRVMDVVWDAVFGGLSERAFRDRVRSVAGNRKPDDVEKILLLKVVLPLADMVGWDVDARLQELGVALADIQGAFRITLRPVSYGAAVRRIASMAKISLLSEELVRRSRDVFVSFVRGIRTREQVKELLQRQQSDAGVGLTREQAESFVRSMDELTTTTQVLSEEQYADWWNRFQQEGSSPTHTSFENQQSSDVEQKNDPSDVVRGQRTGTSPDELDQAIDDAVSTANLTMTDAYLLKRFRNIVSTRFRDVRNALQAKEMFARDQKLGGLGLTSDEAARAGDVIEQVYQAHRDRIGAEQKKRIEAVAEEQKIKQEERKQTESAEHAEWFKKKAGERNASMALRAQLQKTTATITQEQGKKAGAPTMDAIVGSARMMGLSDELGSMTWETYRRMAKEPNEAAARVAQKFETLKQEGFDRWTEGVQAWRASPIQKSYLTLVAESFAAAKPVAQMVEEHRASDPTLPSSAEIASLIELNSHIQY